MTFSGFVKGKKEVWEQPELLFDNRKKWNILSQNYPNPFNPVTNLEFGIAKLGFVSLKIYDVLGRELVTLVNEIKDPGYYKIKFYAGNLSSGVYFYRLVVSSPNPMTAGDYIAVKKFVVLK